MKSKTQIKQKNDLVNDYSLISESISFGFCRKSYLKMIVNSWDLQKNCYAAPSRNIVE